MEKALVNQVPDEPQNLRELFFSLPRSPLAVCSVAELGSLFIHLFRDATTIYRMVFDQETIADSLITNHKELWSFKHLNRDASVAKGISDAVEILHREFKALTYRMTECLVPELTERLGRGERSVNLAIERDDAGKLAIVRNAVPGAQATERLERPDLFIVELTDSTGEALPLLLHNGSKVGRNGESLLHVGLALRDQAIAGFQQPHGVFQWMRDVIGLQDTVFMTALRFRRVFLEALGEQYPGLDPAEVGFDVPKRERIKIAQSIRDNAALYGWAQQVIEIYSPGRQEKLERHTLRDVLQLVGVEDTPYEIGSPQEAATLIFALSASLPVKMPKVFFTDKPEREVPIAPAELVEKIKEFCYVISSLTENQEAARLIRENRAMITELAQWLEINQLPTEGGSIVGALLDEY